MECLLSPVKCLPSPVKCLLLKLKCLLPAMRWFLTHPSQEGQMMRCVPPAMDGLLPRFEGMCPAMKPTLSRMKPTRQAVSCSLTIMEPGQTAMQRRQPVGVRVPPAID